MPKAISLVDELTDDKNFRFYVKKITLIPSSGGVLDVKVDDQLIFSKKELDRYPEEDEIPKIIRSR